MVSYSDFMRFAKTNNVVERIFIKLAKTTFWAQIVWSLSDTEVYNLNMSVPDKEQAWNIIFANSNSVVVWVFSGHNSQSFLESAARQECVNVQHTDLLILRKRVWWLNQTWFLAPRNFLRGKESVCLFSEHAWVSLQHWMTTLTGHLPARSSFVHDAQPNRFVKQTKDKTSFPPLTSDNRPLPSLISHFQQWLQHSLPSLRSLFF